MVNTGKPTIDSEEETSDEYQAEQTIELLEQNEWVASHYRAEDEGY